jgi:hypothetical protein
MPQLADIESFGRHLETVGPGPGHDLSPACTVACFYRCAEQEGLIDHSPAVHVRRPQLDYESHATGLDRHATHHLSRRRRRERTDRPLWHA